MTTQSVPARLPDFAPAPEPGTRRIIDQQERVYYEGYWIKTYPVPGDCLAAKKNLIEALTRRLFNHTEHGLNVPGVRLREARAAYEAETDPALRRVKGGMLAGALFNRATDIFRRLVELQADGVEIQTDYPLVQECGHCLLEALELGRLVRHRSGQECIDELWGEPFRVFSLSVEEFFESRYLKIGMCLRDIDRIAAAMIEHLQPIPVFEGLAPLVSDFAEAARIKTETLRTDARIFDVWSRFVTAGERLAAYEPGLPAARATRTPGRRVHGLVDGMRLVRAGRSLIFHIVRARSPMPKSMADYLAHLAFYRDKGRISPTLPVMPE